MFLDQYAPCHLTNSVHILLLKLAHLILKLTAANLEALFFRVIHCLFEASVYRIYQPLKVNKLSGEMPFVPVQ